MNTTIPKLLHYIWVGGEPLPDTVIAMLDTWKKFCSDYQIIRWDENNFDIFRNRYAAEAYSERKWAFVSDYIRLSVLYEHGGIYMDTDVEVLRPLDRFLHHQFFSGFENETMYPTAIMGAEPKNAYVQYLLKEYDNISFYKRRFPKNSTTKPMYAV